MGRIIILDFLQNNKKYFLLLIIIKHIYSSSVSNSDDIE